MEERKFMMENSKCFTNMTEHILMQFLKPLLMGTLTSCSGAHATGVGAGSILTLGTCFSAGQSEVPVQAWAQNANTLVILNHAFPSIWKYLWNTVANYIFPRWLLLYYLSHMFYNVTSALPIRTRTYVPSSWNWGDLWDCLNQESMADLLWCDFWSWVTEDSTASARLSCSWNPATLLWGSPGYMKRP